jgi:hypothetical protein
MAPAKRPATKQRRQRKQQQPEAVGLADIPPAIAEELASLRAFKAAVAGAFNAAGNEPMTTKGKKGAAAK